MKCHYIFTMDNFESYKPDQTKLGQPARRLKEPLTFGVEGERPEGQIYHRYAVTDDIRELLSGLNIANRFSQSPGDRQPFGLYFSGYGQCSGEANVNVRPTDKQGIVEVDVNFDLNTMVDDLANKGRYAVFIVMRITPSNFPMFRYRIQEVVEFANGGRDHKMVSRTDYSELVGATAQINLSGLSPEQLSELGSDLQVMVVDRDNPNQEYKFKPYSEIIAEIKDGKT
jgi:hypothetical protein